MCPTENTLVKDEFIVGFNWDSSLSQHVVAKVGNVIKSLDKDLIHNGCCLSGVATWDVSFYTSNLVQAPFYYSRICFATF